MSETNPQHDSVAGIGAGLIGRGWAIVFARARWQVNLYNVSATALDVSRTDFASKTTLVR